MNILKIVPGYPNPFDPVNMIWFRDHFESLAKDHHLKVIVMDNCIHYCKSMYLKTWLKEKKFPIFEPKHTNIEFYPLRFWGAPGYSFKAWNLNQMMRYLNGLLKKIDMSQIDVIHAHFSSPAGNLAREISKQYSIPYVITEHSSHFEGMVENGTNVKNILLNADQIIAVSQELKNELHDFLQKDKRIDIIPMGIDFDFFKIRKKETNEVKHILFVGSLVKHKGVFELIKSIQILKEQGVKLKLIIAGDGREKENVKREVFKNQLTNEVVIKGHQDKEQLLSLYQNTDVFVLPSLRESFGVVVVEALACGTPVVVNRSGGPETFVTEKMGVVLTDNSAQSIAKGIMKILHHDSDYNSDQIRESIMKLFSLGVLREKLNDVYKTIINDRNKL